MYLDVYIVLCFFVVSEITEFTVWLYLPLQIPT